jgi:hypothetical protein
MKWSYNSLSDHGFSYSARINKSKYMVQAGNICPIQFTLTKLVTLSTITKKLGEGWDAMTASDYFRTTNDKENDQTKN